MAQFSDLVEALALIVGFILLFVLAYGVTLAVEWVVAVVRANRHRARKAGAR